MDIVKSGLIYMKKTLAMEGVLQKVGKVGQKS